MALLKRVKPLQIVAGQTVSFEGHSINVVRDLSAGWGLTPYPAASRFQMWLHPPSR